MLTGLAPQAKMSEMDQKQAEKLVGKRVVQDVRAKLPEDMELPELLLPEPKPVFPEPQQPENLKKHRNSCCRPTQEPDLELSALANFPNSRTRFGNLLTSAKLLTIKELQKIFDCDFA
jgi:hypothetical protein